MLNGNVFVLHARGNVLRLCKRLIQRLGNVVFVRFPSASGNCRQFFQLRVNRRRQTLHRHAGFFQQLRGESVLLLQQRGEQVDLLHLLIACRKR